MQPELAELREQGVDLYVVAAGQTSDVENFFTQTQLEATIVHDKDYKISQQYAIEVVPFLVVVDKQGRVAYAQLGWADKAYEDVLSPLLTTLLAESD